MKGMGAVPGHRFFPPIAFLSSPEVGSRCYSGGSLHRRTCITLAVSYHSIEQVGLFRAREAYPAGK